MYCIYSIIDNEKGRDFEIECSKPEDYFYSVLDATPYPDRSPLADTGEKVKEILANNPNVGEMIKKDKKTLEELEELVSKHCDMHSEGETTRGAVSKDEEGDAIDKAFKELQEEGE